jgi:hypothetical protein
MSKQKDDIVTSAVEGGADAIKAVADTILDIFSSTSSKNPEDKLREIIREEIENEKK